MFYCIDNNEVGKKGANYFAYALRSNRSLMLLNLGMCFCKGVDNNTIETEGVKFLADALCENVRLASLSLGYSSLTL